MGQTAIGKAALVLTTDNAGASKGLQTQEKEIKGWGTRVAGYLSSTFGKGAMAGASNIGGQITGKISSWAAAAKGGLSAAGTAIGTYLGGPIGATVGGAIGSAVGDLGVTIAGALTSPMDKLTAFGKTVKAATSLGIDPSQYQGLSQVLATAGVEADQVNHILTDMA
ncbi:MAG TPA: hypothetical protein VH092_00345, partial [Urbifossiella sp.]|nr:hypothetical protein [Urbifossiella sp.]